MPLSLLAEDRSLELRGEVTVRTADVADAPSIHALICEHLAEGHLLPRDLDEILARIDRFVVAVDDDVVACAELAPLSASVAEVRSLVVSQHARGGGLGGRIIDELVYRARRNGFRRLCAFTHSPSYFVRLGFSIVPHAWVPEKIVTDCQHCPLFRKCEKHAVVRSLDHRVSDRVSTAGLHG